MIKNVAIVSLSCGIAGEPFVQFEVEIGLRRLKEYGLQMQISQEQQEAKSDRLKDKSIVISGVFAHHSRDEYKEMIEKHGGKNVGSISGKTSFILAGDNMGPSKLEKAQKLGVPIMNEDEFLQLVGEE